MTKQNKLAPLVDGELREGLCQICNQEYVTPWYAPNDLWNKVMRHPDGRELSEQYAFVCPGCFMKRAKELGVEPAWSLTTDAYLQAAVREGISDFAEWYNEDLSDSYYQIGESTVKEYLQQINQGDDHDS